MRNNQKGFGHVVLFVLLLAVVIVGFAGYRVWSANQDEAATQSTSQTSDSENLTQTSKELDQAGGDLDSGLDTTELDADIDSM